VPAICISYKTGIPLHYESDSIKIKGYVIHTLSNPSHWSSDEGLDEWLTEENVPGIRGLDTRALTRRIRSKATMIVFLKGSKASVTDEEVAVRLQKLGDPNEDDLVRSVTTAEPIHYVNNSDSTLVLVDCGVKYGILRDLLETGVNVVRVPYDSSVDDILEFEPSGIVISNGPGDPKKCRTTIETASRLLQTDIPILGICLGMQILALAAGGDTYKLKFGH